MTKQVDLWAQYKIRVVLIMLAFIPGLLHAGVVVQVDKSITTDAHKWTLQTFEITDKATVAHWVVESLIDMTYVQMTSGVYLKDNNGNNYEAIYSDMPMQPEQKVLQNAHQKVWFLVVFPKLKDGVVSLQYYSSPSFHIDNISIGFSINGTSSLSKSDVDYSTTNGNKSCQIVKVDSQPTQLVVYFDYENSKYVSGGWCSIDRNTYIITDKTGTKLKLTKAEGIPYAPSQHSFKKQYEHLQFKLYFPPIKDGSKIFDLIESGNSVWKFYGVTIK